MTQTVTDWRPDSPGRSDAELLLERLADEGLPLEAGLEGLLALLDHRLAAAGGAR